MDRGKMIQLAITIAIVTIVLAIRGRSMMRQSRLRLETLWVAPLIYTGVVIAMLAGHPPSPGGWAWTIAAAVAGGIAGWWRGSMIAVHVDPETHALNQRASPAAFMVIAAIVILRNGLRQADWAGVPALGLDGAAMGDVLLAFGCALIALTRVELFLRARRLLAMARATSGVAIADPLAKT